MKVKVTLIKYLNINTDSDENQNEISYEAVREAIMYDISDGSNFDDNEMWTKDNECIHYKEDKREYIIERVD